MKLAIITDSIPHGFSANLPKVLESFEESSIRVFAQPITEDSIQNMRQNGIKVVYLKDLIRKIVLWDPPQFSHIIQREEAPIDFQELSCFYRNKKVFVTGGEGFIGSHLTENLLKLPIEELTVFGHGENSAHELCKKFAQDKRFKFVLGDIRDEQKITMSLQKSQASVVFHAAAHKHVPILENYPEEAIKTNIFGTVNTINAALNAGAEQFVLVSTDKAVYPTSALGMSKRIAEKISLALDNVIDNMRLTTVRFGNVFGSVGSVVPTFLDQIANNQSLTITDPEMLRYFMSVDEAARLVLLAATTDRGNLFSFDMGDPLSIKFLAQGLVEYIGFNFDMNKVQIIGNRGGEKSTEDLIYSFEKILESHHKKLLVLQNTENLWTSDDIQATLDLLHKNITAPREEILSLLKDLV